LGLIALLGTLQRVVMAGGKSVNLFPNLLGSLAVYRLKTGT
jgi:hypothetical protein